MEHGMTDLVLNSTPPDESSKNRPKELCKKFTRFLVSTTGLIISNGVIMLLGALIFAYLESYNEIQQCKNARYNYLDVKNTTIKLLMNLSERLDGVGFLSTVQEREVLYELKDYLRSFALSAHNSKYNISIDCEKIGTPNGREFRWSFTGSFLFVVTVVTTIGYGHLAPATTWGRLVCIVYALVGIPVFLLALANIGEILAQLCKIAYVRAVCCGCCYKKTDDETVVREDEEMIEEAALNWQVDPDTGLSLYGSHERREHNSSTPSVVCSECDDEIVTEIKTVPLTLTLVIYLSFLVFGALTFSVLEPDWNWLESFYFSTITATTIGFGDMIFSINLEHGGGITKTIYIILYITFSMAAISMCFQLVADEVHVKLSWFRVNSHTRLVRAASSTRETRLTCIEKDINSGSVDRLE